MVNEKQPISAQHTPDLYNRMSDYYIVLNMYDFFMDRGSCLAECWRRSASVSVYLHCVIMN